MIYFKIFGFSDSQKNNISKQSFTIFKTTLTYLQKSKRFKKILDSSKEKKPQSIEEAIKNVKKNCTTKFDESIDVSFNLNFKQKKRKKLHWEQ